MIGTYNKVNHRLYKLSIQSYLGFIHMDHKIVELKYKTSDAFPESSSVKLVKKTRCKLDHLGETYTERYSAIEQKVVSTLMHCFCTLEQIRRLATFAVLPSDELNSRQYLDFIGHRFDEIDGFLSNFRDACQRFTATSSSGSQPSSSECTGDQFKSKLFLIRSSEIQDVGIRASPPDRRPATGVKHKGFENGRKDLALKHRHRNVRSAGLVGNHSLEISRDKSNLTSCDSEFENDEELSFGKKLNNLCDRNIEKGLKVKKQVFAKLREYRDHLRRIFRWGKSSLAHLHDFLDEALADELIFTISSRMSRILLSVSKLEEASSLVELNLIQKQCFVLEPTTTSMDKSDSNSLGVEGKYDPGLEKEFEDSGFDQSQLFLNLSDLDSHRWVDGEEERQSDDRGEAASKSSKSSSYCYEFRSPPKQIPPPIHLRRNEVNLIHLNKNR